MYIGERDIGETIRIYLLRCTVWCQLGGNGLKPWDDLEENNWVVSAISFISCDRNRFPFCLK